MKIPHLTQRNSARFSIPTCFMCVCGGGGEGEGGEATQKKQKTTLF